MKLMLQGGKIDMKLALQAKDLKIVAPGRRLNLAAMRAKQSGMSMTDRTGPTLNRTRGIDDVEHS
jgi:hypothetical protein